MTSIFIPQSVIRGLKYKLIPNVIQKLIFDHVGQPLNLNLLHSSNLKVELIQHRLYLILI